MKLLSLRLTQTQLLKGTGLGYPSHHTLQTDLTKLTSMPYVASGNAPIVLTDSMTSLLLMSKFLCFQLK